jgi:ubiquinone/menaquinone biosynthesis C-methylase UbiE
MKRYNLEQIKNCYNLTAKQYSDTFSNELDGKPFDREVLKRFSNSLTKESIVYEFATGSGHISQYLFDCGTKNIIATDITNESLNYASQKVPDVKFVEMNMLSTGLPNHSIDGLVCSYGIVHFTYKEIDLVIKEWKRILKPNGKALFCFHIGKGESYSTNSFFNVKNAKGSWNFFKVETILKILKKNDLNYEEVVIRYPYIGKEHPSKRCYIQFIR